jgi:hypothetical protein
VKIGRYEETIVLQSLLLLLLQMQQKQQLATAERLRGTKHPHLLWSYEELTWVEEQVETLHRWLFRCCFC